MLFVQVRSGGILVPFPRPHVTEVVVVAQRLAALGLVLLAEVTSAGLLAVQSVSGHQFAQLEVVDAATGELEIFVELFLAPDNLEVGPEILAQGLVSEDDYEHLEKYTLALFAKGTEMAADQGLILVDTKYEFGQLDGIIYLIDEIHTPDSSRYFYADVYAENQRAGLPQKQLSKEFVREWLIQNGFQGKEGQTVPVMDDERIQLISDRYIELFEKVTGNKFQKNNLDDPLKRIENAILRAL